MSPAVDRTDLEEKSDEVETSRSLPEILTVEQASELLQLSEKTLKKLAQAKRVPSRRVGNQWRFNREVLKDWIAGKDLLESDSNEDSESRVRQDKAR